MSRHLSDESVDVLKAIRKARWGNGEVATAAVIYSHCELALDMSDVRKRLGELVRRGWLTKLQDTYRFTDKAVQKWNAEVGECFYVIPEEEPEMEENHPFEEFTKTIHSAAERFKHLFEPRMILADSDKAEIDTMLAFVEAVSKSAHIEHHNYAIDLVRRLIA